MPMLVAPFITTFADAAGRVTGDAAVIIGDVVFWFTSTVAEDNLIPETPSPVKDPVTPSEYIHASIRMLIVLSSVAVIVSDIRNHPPPTSVTSVPPGPE